MTHNQVAHRFTPLVRSTLSAPRTACASRRRCARICGRSRPIARPARPTLCRRAMRASPTTRALLHRPRTTTRNRCSAYAQVTAPTQRHRSPPCRRRSRVAWCARKPQDGMLAMLAQLAAANCGFCVTTPGVCALGRPSWAMGTSWRTGASYITTKSPTYARATLLFDFLIYNAADRNVAA